MIRDILQDGFILKEKGYYKHAIESFYKALEIDNSSNELMLEIADCYYLMKEEERALNYIEQVLNNNPSHVDSLKLLLKIFCDKCAWKEAEQTAKNIYYITKSADDLAKIFELLNKQKHYTEIFEYNSDVCAVQVLYQKAYAKMYMDELQDAEDIINQVLQKDNCDFNKLLKCEILFKMNKKDECVELLKEIKIDRKNAEALNFAGLVQQYECNFEKAVEYFREAIKINSFEANYYYNCASTYFKLGEISEAKKYYNLAISIAPENQNYHFALANLYYSQKQYKRALEELDYDFFEAKLLKSIILFDSGY